MLDLLEIEITPKPGTLLEAYKQALGRTFELAERLADRINDLTAEAAFEPFTLDRQGWAHDRDCTAQIAALAHINGKLAAALGEAGRE